MSTTHALADLSSVRSPFDVAEIAAWKAILLERRRQIVGDIQGLVQDAMDVEGVQPAANHLADGGSDTDLQDMSLGLADDDKHILTLIDRALAKIDGTVAKPFGVCEYTGEAIALERLELIPWTPLSIEGATYLEQQYLSLAELIAD
ncbi:MAG: TraR/DksA family transcriptional regulator [Planctomycetes bacterium]|nr:TraR/DksA family transcriptional regulator [Planctomycetota bacterium]